MCYALRTFSQLVWNILMLIRWRSCIPKCSQRHVTADRLAPRQSDCARMHSMVSSDRLPSYIKATRSGTEIFKMAWYIPDSPSTYDNWFVIPKASGLSTLTYPLFPDDSWLSRGWCLCPEGTAVHKSACRRTHWSRLRHVSKPLRRAAPLQHLHPVASERKPSLPGVLLCKAVIYTFVVSRTESANGPIVYPRIPLELICKIVV